MRTLKRSNISYLIHVHDGRYYFFESHNLVKKECCHFIINLARFWMTASSIMWSVIVVLLVTRLVDITQCHDYLFTKNKINYNITQFAS